MSLRPFRPFALAVLAVLGACGGGSGSGGGGPVVVVLGDATLSGTYFTVLYTGGTLMAGARVLATTGTLTSDGAGNASHTHVVNDSGSVAPASTTPYGVDVAADGAMTLTVGGSVFARGGIASDGNTALLCSVAPGAFAGILVLERRQGFHDLADLVGGYHYVQHGLAGLGASTSVTGPAAFDGAGGFDVGPLLVNNMGAVAMSPGGPLSYDVIGDGTSATTGGALEGGVSLNGDVALWAGSTIDLQRPSVAFAVRQATAATVATLAGAYWIVLFERDPVSDEFRSLHGTATADGAGGLTLAGTSNTEGVIDDEPPTATTYTVAGSGLLRVNAGGSILEGGLTPDGRFAVLGGGTAAGANPTIAVLCRK